MCYFMPQQFKIPAKHAIHKQVTAQEILRLTDGKIDVISDTLDLSLWWTVTGGWTTRKRWNSRGDWQQKRANYRGYHATPR